MYGGLGIARTNPVKFIVADENLTKGGKRLGEVFE
jgi:hypothetical protein